MTKESLGPSSGSDGIGLNGETVSVAQYGGPAEVGEPWRVGFRAEAGEPAPNKDLDVDFVLYVFVATDPIHLDANNRLSANPANSGGLKKTDLEQGTFINGTTSVTFEEPTDSVEFWLLAGFDYHGAQGYKQDRNFPDYKAWSDSFSISVDEAEEEPPTVTATGEGSSVGPNVTPTEPTGGTTASPAQGLYPQAGFRIFDIQFEKDAEVTDIFGKPTGTLDGQNLYQITFDYAGNPNIAIDTGGRFVKHEIIGGPVVRQKVGEDPNNYSINGICYQDTAKQIDALKDARFGKIASERIPGKRGQPVQFASASTEPIADGGGVDIKSDDARFLYTYSLNTIEIHRNIQEGASNTQLPDDIAGGL